MLRLKRLVCSLFGHTPVAEATPAPTGWIAHSVVCYRCGALLEWWEAPTHV